MLISTLALLTLQGPPAEADLVHSANFERMAAAVVPGADELRWRAIPWRPTLREGLLDGARERKPVLLWAMNGHPLGST